MSGTASDMWKSLVMAVLEGLLADVPDEVAKQFIDDNGPLHRWIQLGLSVDLSLVDMDAIEQILGQSPSLLELVATLAVPPLPAFDVAAHFRVMSMEERKTAEVPIGWISDAAKSIVGSYTEPEPEIAETGLNIHKLCKASVDATILAELGERATTTWAQMYEMMRRQGRGQEGNLLVNSWSNIFYIRDRNNKLWAVDCGWNAGSRCWRVRAFPVTVPSTWDADNRVVSR